VSDLVKNTVLWLVIIGVLVLVFSNFENRSKPDVMNYSEFVGRRQCRSGQAG
jgi:cell division protease FtsH